VIANRICNFVELDVAQEIPNFIPRVATSVGFWCFRTSFGSFFYSNFVEEDFLDDDFLLARGFSATANALGFLVLIFFFISMCFRCSPLVFKIVGGGFGILATLFQGLSFFILRSSVCDAGCTLDTGANLSIAATVFYFASAFSSCFVGADDTEGGE